MAKPGADALPTGRPAARCDAMVTAGFGVSRSCGGLRPAAVWLRQAPAAGAARAAGADGRGRRAEEARRPARAPAPLRARQLGASRQRQHAGSTRSVQALSQKWFFHSRIAANTRTGSATRVPRYLLPIRPPPARGSARKGLVAFSSPSGSAAWACRPRAAAVARFARGERAVAGLDAPWRSRCWRACIRARSRPWCRRAARRASRARRTSAPACPRTRRPQPQAKSVSPQKSAPAP